MTNVTVRGELGPREGRGGRGDPRTPNKKPTAPLGTVPSLITSTGGMIGASYILLAPFYDSVYNKYNFITFDSDNFDCEEDCEYDFRQEDLIVGRKIHIHKTIIVYRNIGNCSFSLFVQAHITEDDSYQSCPVVTVTIKNKTPDFKIHTKKLDTLVIGERPQLFIKRNANSGPLSIISATMIGKLSEEAQV